MTGLAVRDVMTTDVVSAEGSTPYKDLVEALSQHAISAVPIIDDDHRVVGIVSEADLLHKLEFAGGDGRTHLLERRRQRQAKAKASCDMAADLMSRPAVVIGDDAAVSAAARLMDQAKVKRLPVVDG